MQSAVETPMAEAEASETLVEEAPPKGGGMKWIIIAVLVVGLAAGGWFAYPMITGAEEETGEVVAEESAGADKPALFAPLHPPLVINFQDQYGDSHFMQMTLEVMARDQGLIDHVKNHAAVIRSNLILLFSGVEYEQAITREGKEKMLDDALAEIQKIIEAETGETGIEAVYFTGLVIQ